MTVRVSKWFDEFIKSFGRDCDKGKLVAVISHCKDYETYDGYSSVYGIFNKKEYQEIRERFEDYVRAILDGDYEVEVEEEKTPLGWIPEYREKYYYVGDTGTIWGDMFDSDYDKSICTNTKVFKSRKEAIFEAEKMKVTRELEKYAGEFGYDRENWIMWVKFETGIDNPVIKYSYTLTIKEYGLVFESKQKVKEAIKAVGEDRILKYYFGVGNE